MSDEHMGTMEQAQARFLADVDAWKAAMQPLIADRAGHKKRTLNEHEARFRLANSAALLAWHMRNEPEAFGRGLAVMESAQRTE